MAGEGRPDRVSASESGNAARVRVREDVELESGEVLRAGTVAKVFAETEEAFGIEWVDPPPSVVMHSMAIAKHKVEVVS